MLTSVAANGRPRLLNQTLINPVGAVYVYSDLSFITLQYVVGTLAKNLGYVTEDQLLPACNFPGTGVYAPRCRYQQQLRQPHLDSHTWCTGTHVSRHHADVLLRGVRAHPRVRGCRHERDWLPATQGALGQRGAHVAG